MPLPIRVGGCPPGPPLSGSGCVFGSSSGILVVWRLTSVLFLYPKFQNYLQNPCSELDRPGGRQLAGADGSEALVVQANAP